ncbi:hypothetical protein EIP91_000399 [Steccherinum ochraceum]|uniref:F-box domain-containing protein n=1 Tax=Steccherinum ochraceum TaxID=92696 RepID=A0A4R0RJV8_9APHY|nr:hypothetical protein EIP91_000399 [Steccherinum ochraceum]
MVRFSYPDLPVEIFQRISQDLRKKDRIRLLRVSRSLQQVFLPIVYANITLIDLPVAVKCIRTMSRVTKYNLPGMVRSLTISNNRYNTFTYLDFGKFEKKFLVCLERMDNLRNISVSQLRSCSFHPGLLLALFRKSSLCSITLYDAMITNTNPFSIIPTPDWTIFEQPAPQMPCLTTLQISAYRFEEPLRKYLEDLLKRHASQLQALFLTADQIWEFEILKSPVPMPVLTTLELSPSTLGSVAFFEHTPHVTSLSIYEMDDERFTGVVPFPSHILPRLEYYNGPSNVLTQTQLLKGHPLLSTIELDGATFRAESDFTLQDKIISFQPPDWERVAGVLKQVKGTNVKRVALYAHELDIDRWEAVAPYAEKVEHFKVYLSDDWYGTVDYLAPRVFSHIPDLKSFLMSDYPRFRWVDDDFGRFEESLSTDVQQDILDAWEHAMSSEDMAGKWKLEKAAFTSLFTWEKQKDGTWVAGAASKNKNMWHNYEGTDEEDSGRSVKNSDDEESDDDSE